MNIRNAQIEDINKISKLMLQVAEIHSNARKDIFKEKSIEEIKAEVNNRINKKPLLNFYKMWFFIIFEFLYLLDYNNL